MSHVLSRPGGHAAWRWSLWAVRAATAAGLAIDAYVHLDLAGLYAEAGGTVNEGVLFRAEAAVALLTAAAVLVIGRRVCYLAALAVAGSALAVMLVSRYVDIGQFGPFPDLYDPVWFPEKLLAAFAEGAACVTALAGAVIVGLVGAAGARTGTRPPRRWPAAVIRRKGNGNAPTGGTQYDKQVHASRPDQEDPRPADRRASRGRGDRGDSGL
jgi:hypothetical protein